MRTLTITAADWSSVQANGTLWLVRDDTECGWCRGTDDGAPECLRQCDGPPVVFTVATAPCETCEEGCDISMCGDCGEDYSAPCARHLAAGHHASADPYGDMVECGGCCPDCLIELVGPTYILGCGKFRRRERHRSHVWSVQSSDDSPDRDVFCPGGAGVGLVVPPTVILGHAYAVGDPLPIVDARTGTAMPDRVFLYVLNGYVWLRQLAGWDTEVTAALAHYGPPESLIGKWALQLNVGGT